MKLALMFGCQVCGIVCVQGLVGGRKRGEMQCFGPPAVPYVSHIRKTDSTMLYSANRLQTFSVLFYSRHSPICHQLALDLADVPPVSLFEDVVEWLPR